MKNKDLYKREIVEIAISGDKVAVVDNKPVKCSAIKCKECDLFVPRMGCNGSCSKWMNTETTNWSKVPVNTKILVRDYNKEPWKRRYFARFEDGKVYAWNNGATSYSEKRMTVWAQAKLFEEDKNEE